MNVRTQTSIPIVVCVICILNVLRGNLRKIKVT